MPFDAHWIDEQTRILHIQLHTPLQDQELDALRRKLHPIINTPQPLFALLSLHDLNPMELFTRAIANLDGLPLPDFRQHFEQSRMAIVGGGSTLASLLTLANQISGQTELIRPFDDQSKAIEWLRSQAAGQE
jgi:hypothetical protein